MADLGRGGFSKIRRRNRMITSCLECRRRKLKCDKAHPCVNCKKAARDCVFMAPALDSASQLKLTEVKEKMGLLEVSLEQEVARHTRALGSPSVDGSVQNAGRLSIAPDEEYLEPTPTAMADAVFDDDDPDNEFYDLGFKLGKLRLTDRIGGFFRPAMVDELGSLLKDFKHSEAASFGNSFPRPANFIGPDENFLPPSTDPFLSTKAINMSLMHFVPPRATTDRLMAQYWFAVHPVSRLTHRPTVEQLYTSFWADVGMNVEPEAPLQAFIFSILFAASVSVQPEQCIDEYGRTKADLVKESQLLAEEALSRAKFLKSTRFQTLQSFIIYLTPMMRDQISRAHCALAAAAIRLAETMGLHRDGAKFGLKPVDTHVRRLVWCGLLNIDHRCTEARGPRLIIREGDYDTKMPINRNDENLTDNTTLIEPGVVEKWTDMTITCMLYECMHVNRSIWFDRPRIDKKEKSLTEVMVRIENNRRRIYAKYGALTEEGTPLQQLCKVIMELHISKWHVAVLHRFHHSIQAPMPDRIRQILLNTARSQVEAGLAFGSMVSLSPWAWFQGACHSWQCAFLLLVDFYVFPDWDQAERTWRCLDWCFETPAPMQTSNIAKARAILLEIWDRMRIYREARRLRAPIDLLKNISLTDSHKRLAARTIATELRRQGAQGGSEVIEQYDHHQENRNSNPNNSGSNSNNNGSVTSGGSGHDQNNLSPPTAMSPGVSSPSSTNDTNSPDTHLVPIDFGAMPMMSPSSSNNELEMPDVDWNEWDKLFLSNGNQDQMDPSLANFSTFGYMMQPNTALVGTQM